MANLSHHICHHAEQVRIHHRTPARLSVQRTPARRAIRARLHRKALQRPCGGGGRPPYPAGAEGPCSALPWSPRAQQGPQGGCASRQQRGSADAAPAAFGAGKVESAQTTSPAALSCFLEAASAAPAALIERSEILVIVPNVVRFLVMYSGRQDLPGGRQNLPGVNPATASLTKSPLQAVRPVE